MAVKGLIGKKIGMLSYFSEDGQQYGCTAILAGPCFCLDLKTSEKDSYNSVVVGFDQKKEKSTNKPQLGFFKKNGLYPFRKLKEFKYDGEAPKIGDKINIQDVFQEGKYVDVSGVTKGRGFSGGVRRWGFHGGPATHGQSDRERAPGSLGRHGSNSGDVKKGKKMAGHYGSENVTMQNLKVVKILPEQNTILIEGAVPGVKGSYVLIKKAAKKKQ